MKKSALRESDLGHEILRHFCEFSSLDCNEFLELLKETVSQWIDDNAPRLSASLAFYTLLSTAPFLIVIAAVAALVYGQQAARGQLLWQLHYVVGLDVAKSIQGLIQGAYKPGAGIVASLLSLLALVFGSSSVVVELRDALNIIWHVAPDPRNTGLASIVWMAKERFYSFALILCVGFLLFASLLFNSGIAAMGSVFPSFLAASEAALHAGAFFLSFFVITFLFAAIYKLLPDVHLRWSDVVIGASDTSLLFTVGKQLIALYLGKATFGSTYGAAGSLLIVLVWVYYSAMLFFLGAEFTKVYAKTFGSHLSNKVQAVPPAADNHVVDPSTGLTVAPRQVAPDLVEAGCDLETLGALSARFEDETLADVITRFTASFTLNRLVEQLESGTSRIADLVHAIKQYSYMDQASEQEIDIHEGLENTLIMLHYRRKHGIEVVREYDRSILRFCARGSELNQVWTNLIDNAVDAMGGRGRLVVRTESGFNSILVEIRDNGPGIPPEIRNRIFEPFFTIKEVGEGTGLGLDTVYRIVQKHRGQVSVDSEPGRTSFQVRLPFARQSSIP